VRRKLVKHEAQGRTFKAACKKISKKASCEGALSRVILVEAGIRVSRDGGERQ
jgi:hypothetical protein